MKKGGWILSVLMFVVTLVAILKLSKSCENIDGRLIDKKVEKILKKDSLFTKHIEDKKTKIDSVVKKEIKKDSSLLKKGERLEEKIINRELSPIDSIAKGKDSVAIKSYGELVKDQDSLIKNKNERLVIKDTIIENLKRKNNLSDSLINKKNTTINKIVIENEKNLKRYNRVARVAIVTSLTLLLIILL